MEFVGETHLRRNGLQRQVSGQEQVSRAADPQQAYFLHRRMAGRLAEEPAEVEFAQPGVSGELIERKRRVEVLTDESAHGRDEVGFLRGLPIEVLQFAAEDRAAGGNLMVGYHKRSELATVRAKAEIDRLRASGEVGKRRYLRVTKPPGDWLAGGWNEVIKGENFPRRSHPIPCRPIWMRRHSRSTSSW